MSKIHGNRALSIFEESLVLGYLLMRSEVSLAEKIDGVIEFSKCLDCGGVSRSTAERMVERHSDVLRSTKERRMASNRTDPVIIEHTNEFITIWDTVLATHHNLPLDLIINADETMLRATKDGTAIQRLESVHKKGGSEFLSSKECVGSMTPFVSASGIVWLLVFCLKLPPNCRKNDGTFEMYVPLEERGSRAKNSPHSILICGTPSGLMNSYWWNQAIQKLITIVRQISSREIILVTDNLGIH